MEGGSEDGEEEKEPTGTQKFGLLDKIRRRELRDDGVNHLFDGKWENSPSLDRRANQRNRFPTEPQNTETQKQESDK